MFKLALPLVILSSSLLLQACNLNPFSSQPTTPPSPLPSPSATPVADTVKLYLISLNDQGQKGPPVGCGDSLVPIERQVLPQQEPLFSAIRQLLDLDQQFYDDSDLYNSLSRSSLTLQDITVSDNTAFVYLTGSYSLGGVCDEPRFRSQLEQTILQFSQIDSTQIFINNQSLDSLFTSQGA